jgi:catechol-2,3-dioxygenase
MKLVRVQHVKLPVTDLRRSTRWYASLLDLKLIREFVESGTLRGVALRDPAGNIHIALRERDACASRPVLTGFDPFALRVESRKDLHDVVNRCAQLGIEHGGIQDRGGEEAVCDVIDPDGTVLRFLWTSGADEDVFVGLSFDKSGAPSFYDVPRVRLE